MVYTCVHCTPKEIQHGIRKWPFQKKEGWNFDLMVALPFYIPQGQPRMLRFVRFSGGVCFVRAAPSLPITHYSSIAYGVSKNKGTPKSSILMGFYPKPSILGYPNYSNPHIWSAFWLSLLAGNGGNQQIHQPRIVMIRICEDRSFRAHLNKAALRHSNASNVSWPIFHPIMGRRNLPAPTNVRRVSTSDSSFYLSKQQSFESRNQRLSLACQGNCTPLHCNINEYVHELTDMFSLNDFEVRVVHTLIVSIKEVPKTVKNYAIQL